MLIYFESGGQFVEHRHLRDSPKVIAQHVSCLVGGCEIAMMPTDRIGDALCGFVMHATARKPSTQHGHSYCRVMNGFANMSRIPLVGQSLLKLL